MSFINLIFYFTILVFSAEDMSNVAKKYSVIISSYTDKIGLIYFESTDIPKDGVIFTEKLMDGILKEGKIKVIDPMVMGIKLKKMGIKNIGEINIKNQSAVIKELGTSYIIMGSVSRINNEIESRGRIIKLPEMEVLNVLTHRIKSYWEDEDNNKNVIKKFNRDGISNFKPTEECKYPELVKLASEMSISYSFACVDFPCSMIDCSKYPTTKSKIHKIYFQDPDKTVVVTDDSFNVLEEYKTK